jgi:tight adherence protein C
MALMYALLSFTVTTSLIYLAGKHVLGDSPTVNRRLQDLSKGDAYSEYQHQVSKPLSQRVILPLIKKLSEVGLRSSPIRSREALSDKLRAAGNPFGLGVGEFIAIRMLLIILLGFAGVMISGGKGTMNALKMGVLLAAIGGLTPDIVLNSKVAGRKAEIQYCLPDALDLLTVSVEAGLGFDAALSKVVEKSKGALSQEFARLLQEIRIGKPRREALRELSDKVQVDDFSSFAATLIQAEQLGVSIGKILRVQSETMRTRRRQRAQENAMKAPIKILFPMIFFIFPAIFIVLLGPAVLNLISALRSSGVLG